MIVAARFRLYDGALPLAGDILRLLADFPEKTQYMTASNLVSTAS